MTFRAHIGDRAVEVQPRETLLEAALRAGLDVPHGCRVGGCGSCKCRVTEGSVREQTETAYLLSQAELDEGVVLACQTVPQSDVVVEVELARGRPGRVVAQRPVSPDIVRLVVQLDAPLPYRAGQYANLRIEGLEGVSRSYSFATPTRPDGQVSFYVRRVPGGAFSSLVNDEDVTGRRIWVDGPRGDFYARPSEAPLVLVAGGSGLAPILALLEDAAADGVDRPATLYFGARTRQDLYALDEIEGVRDRWRGEFTFVPVLSEAGDDPGWTGRRGRVTDHVDAPPGSHGYLCGPPGMVDAAEAVLRSQGVEVIYADRFTTRADVAPDRPPAGVVDYLKFFGFSAVGLASLVTLLAGGPWISWGLLGIVLFYIVGDACLGDDTSTPDYRWPGVLTVQLWLALPLLALIVFAAVWSVSPVDMLGFGALVEALTGYDALEARAATGWAHHVSGFVLTGLMIGLVGTIPGHELTHRTWDPTSLAVGRWLLAFSFDTVFAIEHVYGHHRYVATEADPATAPRGRNVYAHILVSTVKGNLSAWQIETARLRKRRLPQLSWHNAVIRGHLASVSLVVVFGLLGGPVAAVYFVACGLWGKALLEIVNYMEHYGMIRDPSLPVEPRHSWNTNRRISSWSMFNLTRHSHHHAQGEVPYHALEPFPDAPLMIGGYLTTLIVAMIPPLWHRLMTPKVREWDRVYASAEERRRAAEANARSGLFAASADGYGSVH